MWKVICALLVLLGPLFQAQAKPPACENNQLEASVTNIDTKKFTVTFEITNNGNDPVCVLKWNTMMDDEYWASAVDMWESKVGTEKKKRKTLQDDKDWKEKHMSFAKPIKPIRRDITGRDYEYFDVQDSITYTRSLGDVFSFINKRHYWIQIETKSSDCYVVTDEKRGCSPTLKADDQQQLDYEKIDDASVSKYFTAQKELQAKSESFQQWLDKQKLLHLRPVTDGVGNYRVAIFGATTKQANELISAHKEAKQYIKDAYAHFQKKSATDKRLVATWFGKDSKLAEKHFRETMQGAEHPYVYNILPNKLCKTGWYAHVEMPGKRQHVINICPLFYQDHEDHEKTVTIVHEMTHDSAATIDKEYGEKDCKNLAKKQPVQAVWNADNYALFAAAVHKQLRLQDILRMRLLDKTKQKSSATHKYRVEPTHQKGDVKKIQRKHQIQPTRKSTKLIRLGKRPKPEPVEKNIRKLSESKEKIKRKKKNKSKNPFGKKTMLGAILHLMTLLNL